MTSSPFGQYAGLVALISALGVLAAWLASVVGLIPQNATLDGLALLVLGIIFGTGAGATVVANGAAHKAEAANVRLDAVSAPPAVIAEQIVKEQAAAVVSNGGTTPST